MWISVYPSLRVWLFVFDWPNIGRFSIVCWYLAPRIQHKLAKNRRTVPCNNLSNVDLISMGYQLLPSTRVVPIVSTVYPVFVIGVRSIMLCDVKESRADEAQESVRIHNRSQTRQTVKNQGATDVMYRGPVLNRKWYESRSQLTSVAPVGQPLFHYRRRK